MFLTVYTGSRSAETSATSSFKYGAVQTILARYLITNDSRRNGLPVEPFPVAVAKSSKRARRDGTMALARTSGQVLANPDNMAVFCSGRKQLELQKTLQLYVYLQIHQPMADRKREW
ncbi:hypothetical protein NP493_322g00002 [Ridgeia piscesae]|uniref:Uncharacterized protein n=1 Tax=Ridgeia piscesae TaxID=27915 RepID=A0AAD9NVW4_RIDPI|nr:hypothetical protein NP493_322g00002 [Ridgeia piscesae]